MGRGEQQRFLRPPTIPSRCLDGGLIRERWTFLTLLFCRIRIEDDDTRLVCRGRCRLAAGEGGLMRRLCLTVGRRKRLCGLASNRRAFWNDSCGGSGVRVNSRLSRHIACAPAHHAEGSDEPRSRGVRPGSTAPNKGLLRARRHISCTEKRVERNSPFVQRRHQNDAAVQLDRSWRSW